MLTDAQKIKSLSLLQNFIDSGELVIRKEGPLKRTAFQELRKEIIKELRIYINDFLNSEIDLESFKKKIDSINKKNNHWGFTAIKGQMFFNQYSNASEDKKALDLELKKAIIPPQGIQEAKKQIDNFSTFVAMLGAGAKDRRTVPNISSIPYFLSYFWQIADYEKYPVFYHSTDTAFKELGFMPEHFETLGEKYISFYNLLEELRSLFREKAHREFSFWDVEHIFWFYYGKETSIVSKPTKQKEEKVKKADLIEDDYIPPIVKEIPLLAIGSEELVKKYASIGKKVEDVFEEKLYKLFVMLGFETERLGKGKGRVPDGIILARQEQYAVIYDAKSRMEPYSIGTDSRAIIEYINSYSNQLHKQGIKNIYFAIISSDFRDGQDDEIKNIKMETGIQEFLLLKAELLLGLLELKLRNSSIELGKGGLQQIFQHHGVITKEEIQEALVGM